MLAGRRILVVEDEFYIADDVTRALRKSGAEVVGPVATVADAEQCIGASELDCAILDMNLRGNMSFPIADPLEQAGIPFLIATGYDSFSLPDRFTGRPRIEKPFEAEQVVKAIPPLLAPRG